MEELADIVRLVIGQPAEYFITDVLFMALEGVLLLERQAVLMETLRLFPAKL